MHHHHHKAIHNIFKPVEHHHTTSSHNIFKPHHQPAPPHIRHSFFTPHPIELKPIHRTHHNNITHPIELKPIHLTHHNNIHHNNQQPSKPITTIFSKGDPVVATVDEVLTPDNSYLLFIGAGVLVALYLTTNK